MGENLFWLHLLEDGVHPPQLWSKEISATAAVAFLAPRPLDLIVNR